MSITVLASLVFLPPLGDENRVLLTAVGAMAISANIVIEFLAGNYFAVDAQSNPLLHTWSLSVEEQFYVLFPMLVLAGLLWGRSRNGSISMVLVLVGALSAVSLSLAMAAAYLSLPVGETLLGFYSPLSRAWEFGAGALVALTAGTWNRAPRALLVIFGWVGLTLVFAGFAVIPRNPSFLER